MPVYEYTALDMSGKKVSGIIDTESAMTARQKLRSSNIFPVSIKEVYADTVSKEPGSLSISVSNPFARVKPSDISMMTRQLATLISAGFPLVSAIYSLISQTKSRQLKRTLSQIKDLIEEGSSFADALSGYPGIFPSIYTNMVRAGESSGTLEIVLERLADITEKQRTLMLKVRSIMYYPVVMFTIATFVLYFMLVFLVPRLTTIFSDLEQVLPLPTRLLISSSNFFSTYWWLLLIVILVSGGTFYGIRKTSKGLYFIDKWTLKLPFFGSLFEKLSISRFARTLGSLLENGVSMLTALDIVKNVVGNSLIAETIEKSAIEVEKGHGLSEALGAYKVFPDLTVQMIQVGEHSGDLESMLNKIADIYENEVELTAVGITSLLEPAIVVIMAVVIGFIVLSIALPIMEMNQLVR